MAKYWAIFVYSCTLIAPLVFSTTEAYQFFSTSNTNNPSARGFLDQTISCWGNSKEQVPLTAIRPQVYYLRAGARANYTRPLHIFELGYTNDEIVRYVKPSGGKRIKFITHGFTDSWNGAGKFIGRIIDVLQSAPMSTYDVFVLNWPNKFVLRAHGKERAYSKVAATTRTVGSYLGNFIVRLRQNVPKIELDNIHLIGHSLGAHVMGFAGAYVKQVLGPDQLVAHITALDAAGPCYSASMSRVSTNDAKLVDAIHTNAGLLGIDRSIGHRDLWINDGQVQPGCSVWDISCSHARSHDLYTERGSDTCQMVAYRCRSQEQFLSGTCESCQRDPSRCAVVSLITTIAIDDELTAQSQPQLIGGTGDYYIHTGGKIGHYCQQHYQVVAMGNFEPDISTSSPFYLYEGKRVHHIRSMHQLNSTVYSTLLTFGGPQANGPMIHARVRAKTRSSNSRLILVISFMSNISPDIRSSLSSVLCSTFNMPIVPGQIVDLSPCANPEMWRLLVEWTVQKWPKPNVVRSHSTSRSLLSFMPYILPPN